MDLILHCGLQDFENALRAVMLECYQPYDNAIKNID